MYTSYNNPLDILEKIKLAKNAIAYRKAKVKLASHILNEFFNASTAVKVAALNNDKYATLLKLALQLIEHGVQFEDNRPVGVYRAVEDVRPNLGVVRSTSKIPSEALINEYKKLKIIPNEFRTTAKVFGEGVAKKPFSLFKLLKGFRV